MHELTFLCTNETSIFKKGPWDDHFILGGCWKTISSFYSSCTQLPMIHRYNSGIGPIGTIQSDTTPQIIGYVQDTYTCIKIS